MPDETRRERLTIRTRSFYAVAGGAIGALTAVGLIEAFAVDPMGIRFVASGAFIGVVVGFLWGDSGLRAISGVLWGG